MSLKAMHTRLKRAEDRQGASDELPALFITVTGLDVAGFVTTSTGQEVKRREGESAAELMARCRRELPGVRVFHGAYPANNQGARG